MEWVNSTNGVIYILVMLFQVKSLSNSILIFRFSILLLSNTNRAIKTNNILFSPWINISANRVIIMSNVLYLLTYNVF